LQASRAVQTNRTLTLFSGGKNPSSREDLRSSWPVQGTTGYEFTNLLNGLFVATSNAERMTRLYNSFIGARIDFDDLLYRSKSLL